MTQLIVNGLIAGSGHALVALGFSLIYSTARFFHFAHGAIYAWAAYLVYLLAVGLYVPFLVALPLGLGVVAGLGLAIEVMVYRPLRARNASALVLLLVSLGLFVALQGLIPVAFGEGTRSLRGGLVRPGFEVLGARITPVQAGIVATTTALFLLVSLVLRRTRIGTAVRAVATDAELARISGVPTDRVLALSFAAGSALAGVAATLAALDVDLTPTMGFNALLMGVVAMIIGGVGSVPGAAVGGLLVGLAQHAAVFSVSSQWQDAIAFGLLLVFLLFRPSGVLGYRSWKVSV